MLTREGFLSNIGQIVKNIAMRAEENRRNPVKIGVLERWHKHHIQIRSFTLDKKIELLQPVC